MSCRVWSPTVDKPFTGLCSMKMLAESTTRTTNCSVCVTPLTCMPGCTFMWDGESWVLNTDCCAVGTTPTEPAEAGTTIGETAAGTCT